MTYARNQTKQREREREEGRWVWETRITYLVRLLDQQVSALGRLALCAWASAALRTVSP